VSIVRSKRVENQIAPTFASLFTGGGLADVGAMAAGYKLLWGVEYDPAIAAVANANLPHADQVYAESVVGFGWANVERPDHLHMSPPCQDFSVAKSTGKASNDNDALAQACIDAIKALDPSTVTLENVEGYRKATGFQAIVDALWGLGYWVNVDVLNSADFGVPQTRRRLILRAVKGGFPRPLPEPVRPWKGWYQAIEDLIPSLPETQFAAWQLAVMPSNLSDCFVVDDQYNGEPNLDGNRGLTIRAADQPMFTVSASQSKRSVRAKVGNAIVRFNTRAFGRIQSLPDWYQDATLKIIGNGVPCLMMQRVMETF